MSDDNSDGDDLDVEVYFSMVFLVIFILIVLELQKPSFT